MFALVEQLGNELIWLEWMLDNPSVQFVRPEMELLQQALMRTMDGLIQEQPALPETLLHDINLHFQSIRNAIANESESLKSSVQTVCKVLSAL